MQGTILGAGGYGSELNRQIPSHTELAFSHYNKLVHMRESKQMNKILLNGAKCL